MNYNVFTFGNKFFIQINGTAMGTNTACMYAAIEYSYHEETMAMKHNSVKLYRRLIDDAFVFFKDEGNNFQTLQDLMNDF